MKNSNVLGTIGDNYRMKDCPFHLPKENLAFFTYMQDNAAKEPYANYGQYGNAYIHQKGNRNYDQLHR